MLNLAFSTSPNGDFSSFLVVELQLHLREIIEVKETTHRVYEVKLQCTQTHTQE